MCLTHCIRLGKLNSFLTTMTEPGPNLCEDLRTTELFQRLTSVIHSLTMSHAICLNEQFTLSCLRSNLYRVFPSKKGDKLYLNARVLGTGVECKLRTRCSILTLFFDKTYSARKVSHRGSRACPCPRPRHGRSHPGKARPCRWPAGTGSHRRGTGGLRPESASRASKSSESGGRSRSPQTERRPRGG